MKVMLIVAVGMAILGGGFVVRNRQVSANSGQTILSSIGTNVPDYFVWVKAGVESVGKTSQELKQALEVLGIPITEAVPWYDRDDQAGFTKWTWNLDISPRFYQGPTRIWARIGPDRRVRSIVFQFGLLTAPPEDQLAGQKF